MTRFPRLHALLTGKRDAPDLGLPSAALWIAAGTVLVGALAALSFFIQP